MKKLMMVAAVLALLTTSQDAMAGSGAFTAVQAQKVKAALLQKQREATRLKQEQDRLFNLQREAQRDAAKGVVRNAREPLYYKPAVNFRNDAQRALIARMRDTRETNLAGTNVVSARDLQVRRINEGRKPVVVTQPVQRLVPQIATVNAQQQRELLDSLAGARTPARVGSATQQQPRTATTPATNRYSGVAANTRTTTTPSATRYSGVAANTGTAAVGNTSSFSTRGGQTVLGIADASQLDLDVAR